MRWACNNCGVETSSQREPPHGCPICAKPRAGWKCIRRTNEPDSRAAERRRAEERLRTDRTLTLWCDASFIDGTQQGAIAIVRADNGDVLDSRLVAARHATRAETDAVKAAFALGRGFVDQGFGVTIFTDCIMASKLNPPKGCTLAHRNRRFNLAHVEASRVIRPRRVGALESE